MNNKEARSIQMSSGNAHVIIDKHKMMKTKHNIFITVQFISCD